MGQRRAALAALTSVRSLVAISALVWLYLIARDRILLFVYNDIIVRRTPLQTERPWFGVAVCLGPHMSELTVRRFINLSSWHFPGRYERHERVLARDGKQWGPEYTVINDTHVSETFFNASRPVDSVVAYELFFSKWFNWKDDMLALSSAAPAEVARLISSVRHSLMLDGLPIQADRVAYTDLPFLMHYSFCRNYSFSLRYHREAKHIFSAFLQRKQLRVEELTHEISFSRSAYEDLFQSGVAQYIDLYVYESGSFTEHPLIQDHIPYRVDLSEHLLLSVVGEKHIRISRAGARCARHRRHRFTSCLTWCLVRGLLRRLRCLLPVLLPYVYNTSAPLRQLQPAVERRRVSLPLTRAFPPARAWPWMRRFTQLPLCSSAAQFNRTFRQWKRTFFPRGRQRYPNSPECEERCRRECTRYKVAMSLSGTKLVVLREERRADNASEKGVTLAHQLIINSSGEHWIYNQRQLMIDLSGVLSFLLGMSVIAIFDWIFMFCEWLMHKCDRLDFPLTLPVDEFDEVRERRSSSGGGSAELERRKSGGDGDSAARSRASPAGGASSALLQPPPSDVLSPLPEGGSESSDDGARRRGTRRRRTRRRGTRRRSSRRRSDLSV